MLKRPLLLALLFTISAWPQQSPILNCALAGSQSCKGRPCWNAVGSREVQKALLAVAKTPLPAAELTALLGESGTTIADLEALRLIRRHARGYRIAFTLFPAEDVKLSRARADVHARALADSLLARRPEIEAALRAYSAPGVDAKDVAFIVLGCFSLDWDGLRIARDGGYRTAGSRPDGRYVPWAEEPVEEDYRSYCKSTSSQRREGGVVSFGDGTGHNGFLLNAWQDPARGPALASMLLAMRDGNAPPPASKALLDELVQRGYVNVAGGRYTIAFPVLSRRDAPMVSRLRQIGREAIQSWLATGYPALKSELAETAPLRAGVPYAETFTLIWHHVFGRANLRLVEAGLFADPYAPDRKWRRHTPAVYDLSLTR